jgi:predicted ATPase
MTQTIAITEVRPEKAGKPFLERVRIKNYRSIGICDVCLRPLTLLVGRNGSGKSNFLDALRFVVDSLQTSLDHAIKSRGGIDAVRRRSTGHPRNFLIDLAMNLPGSHSASYAFEISSARGGFFVVKSERLSMRIEKGEKTASYRLEEGEIKEKTFESMPPASPDRLYLVNAAGLPPFRGVYDALLSMGFYNLNPEGMKVLQSPDAGELLHRDGNNIASVIARLGADNYPEQSTLRF